MFVMSLDIAFVFNLHLDSQIKGITLLLKHALNDTDLETRTAHPSHMFCAKITLGYEAERLGEERNDAVVTTSD